MLHTQVRTSTYRQGWWLGVSQGEEFDRGVAAGTIAARLDQHDKHFEAINGSIADVAKELHGINLTIQRQGDQAQSRDEAAMIVARALKEASEKRWMPLSRLGALIGVAVGLLTLFTVIILYFNN